MSFQIPKKAMLSFGRKQLFDTFWRMAQQIEQKNCPHAEFEQLVIQLKSILNSLKISMKENQRLSFCQKLT